MTTILLNLQNLGLFKLNSMILAMGIFYGGVAQIIAGMMEFRKGNTFAHSLQCAQGAVGLRQQIHQRCRVFHGGGKGPGTNAQ